MATSTLFSGIGYGQNQAGPTVPANTIVNAGGLVTKAGFTLTVTPATGYAEAVVNYGPDGVMYPGQLTVYDAPGAPTGILQEHRLHGAALSPASGGNDGAQYFTAELMKIAPGCTATLTVTY